MHACLDDSLRCIGSAGLSELGSNGSRFGGSWDVGGRLLRLYGRLATSRTPSASGGGPKTGPSWYSGGCWHWSPEYPIGCRACSACCRSRSRRFDDDSAPSLQSTSPAAQRDHFGAILSAAPDLPAVIYNSPYYGYETRADLFFQMHAEHANLVGFKEFGGKASLTYAAEHITGSDRGFLYWWGWTPKWFMASCVVEPLGPSMVSAMPPKGGVAFDGALSHGHSWGPTGKSLCHGPEEALGVFHRMTKVQTWCFITNISYVLRGTRRLREPFQSHRCAHSQPTIASACSVEDVQGLVVSVGRRKLSGP